MSYTYLLEQGEESLAASYSDIPLSVLSRLNLTQEKCCSKDSETASCQSSQYGMMSAPLTESRGEERLMSSAEDFHAKTLVSQEKEQESQESVVDSGEKWHASFARWDRDSRSWKTRQCSLFEDLTECLAIFPRWGMMHNGELWELAMLAHLTEENESGLWPTPRSCSAMAATITPESAWNEKRNPNLETIVGRRMWGNPKAQDSRHALTDRGKSNLGEQVAGLHNGGKLNPNWVEWLMGWPIGWTDLKLLEMDKYQQWLHSHGEPFHNEKIAATPGEQEAR
jgi:hypothetical protein